MSVMTKTAAAKAARAHLARYGYHDIGFTDAGKDPTDGGPEMKIGCPRRGHWIYATRTYGYFPVPKGRPYSAEINGKRCTYRQESRREAIIRAVIYHLTTPGECPADPDQAAELAGGQTPAEGYLEEKAGTYDA